MILPVVTNNLKIEALCFFKFFQGSDKLCFERNLNKGIMFIIHMKDNEIVLLGRQGNLSINYKYSKTWRKKYNMNFSGNGLFSNILKNTWWRSLKSIFLVTTSASIAFPPFCLGSCFSLPIRNIPLGVTTRSRDTCFKPYFEIFLFIVIFYNTDTK